MSSFANLKRNKSSFEKLTKAIEATSQSTPEAGSKDDTRFWQPEVDKAGNGMAVIRFLPAPAVDGDDALPWIRVFSHGFQGPGGWLIDNCLTTLNEKCPVCEHNNTLWNSGIEDNKNVARKQKRKLSYIANILVISDPSNKQNEGTIRLFKFGKKIFDKTVRGVDAGSPYSIDYKPSKDIKKDYSADVRYGMLAGLNPAQGLIFMLQALGAKIISKLSNKKMKSNQENLFVVLNGIKEMKNVFKYILKQKNDSKTTQEVQKDLVDA